MAYTRLLFNSLKETTPYFIKTIPFNKTVKPVLGKKAPVGWKMCLDPKYKAFMKFIHRNIMCNSLNYQIFFFGVTYAITSIFFYPGLYIYQSNNAHRQLNVAIEKENEYKKKKQLEEEAEDEDEEE